MQHKEGFNRANSKQSVQWDDLLWKTRWFLSNHNSDNKAFAALFQIKEGLFQPKFDERYSCIQSQKPDRLKI